jgi:hypothetical protein
MGRVSKEPEIYQITVGFRNMERYEKFIVLEFSALHYTVWAVAPPLPTR